MRKDRGEVASTKVVLVVTVKVLLGVCVTVLGTLLEELPHEGRILRRRCLAAGPNTRLADWDLKHGGGGCRRKDEKATEASAASARVRQRLGGAPRT